MSIDNDADRRRTSVRWIWLAAVAVFVVVLLALGGLFLLMMPLIYPEQLPDNTAKLLIEPPPPPPPPPLVSSSPQVPAAINSEHPAYQTPAHSGVAGSDFGSSGNVMGSLFGSGPNVKAAPAKKLVISGGVMAGMLVLKTTPIYPPIAKAARVSGTVVLQATISKSGSVESLKVISGPAMLQQAAMDAVRQWRYKPYLLNGEPVEVETTVNVIFTLGG